MDATSAIVTKTTSPTTSALCQRDCIVRLLPPMLHLHSVPSCRVEYGIKASLVNFFALSRLRRHPAPEWKIDLRIDVHCALVEDSVSIRAQFVEALQDVGLRVVAVDPANTAFEAMMQGSPSRPARGRAKIKLAVGGNPTTNWIEMHVVAGPHKLERAQRYCA